MKVKELIEILQNLDPNRDVWVLENEYRACDPYIIEADGSEVDSKIKVGDYIL